MVVTRRPRWWQWPTILSLDAPLVSVLWQDALAHVAGISLRPSHRVVLAATVWLAYAADRWIEGWRLDPRAIRTQRHEFYQRWRWPVAAAWTAVAVADVVLAFTRLSWMEIGAGVLVIVPVLVYLLSHQLVHRHSRWRAPKELCVAALLTSGVCVFLVETTHLADLASAASLFALLCFANCALISVWERDVDLSHGQTSLAIDLGVSRRGAREHGWAIAQLPLLVAVLSIAAFVSDTGPLRTIAACAFVSALLLAAIDRLERRAGWRAARVLADVALLTPIVPAVLWWASWWAA